MKLVNIKIIITSILCIIFITIKVKTKTNTFENSQPDSWNTVSNISSSSAKTQSTPKNDTLQDILQVFNHRRRHVGEMCEKHRTEIGNQRWPVDRLTGQHWLELQYKERWGSNVTWEEVIGKADVLERPEQGFLWCKVPKAASESWVSVMIKRW